VGPRAVLDAVVKRKIPSPRRESNPRTPVVQPRAMRDEKYIQNPCRKPEGKKKKKKKKI
jgi:hypothetical protein